MSSPVTRATLILLGSAASFWLAILGYGSPTRFFAHPALVALAMATAIMVAAALFVGGNISAGEREDRSNRWVLVAFAIIGLLNAYLPAWADRRNIGTLDGETIRWVGVAIFAIGGVLRLWPVAVLGNRFSGLVAIQPGHELVTTGIYATIRHPSYLGMLLNTLGWALAFRSGFGLGLTALMLPPLIARIMSEERLLHEKFGAEYDGYRARTARLLPGLW